MKTKYAHLITFETTKMLMFLNYHFDNENTGAHYYFQGTPIFLTPNEFSFLKQNKAIDLWRTCTMMEIHEWLAEEHKISIEPLLKSKNKDGGTYYEVYINNLTTGSNIESITVYGTYYQAMIKGIERVCYVLSGK